MRISKLQVRQFRNLSDVELSPHPVLNLLIGDNGQGKTSLIEAIHFLSTLRSFRTHQNHDLVQMGKDGFSLHCLFEDREQEIELKIKIEEGKRKLFLNEKAAPVSNFSTKLRTVVFSPESLNSIKSGPEARRDLIDQAVYQISPEAREAQRNFSRVLKQRNACLRQMRDLEISHTQGFEILESLEPFYLQSGAEIIEARLTLLEKIFNKMAPVLDDITGEENSANYLYRSSAGPWPLRQYSDLREQLRGELRASERQQAEVAAGVTLTGPHRHDISFVFNGNDSRIFCSQGQQRAVILAFKIAEIVYHNEVFESYPILLLDDVLSEFDERKRNYLIEFLQGNQAQTFLTTTDQVHGLRGSTIFQVANGKALRSAWPPTQN